MDSYSNLGKKAVWLHKDDGTSNNTPLATGLTSLTLPRESVSSQYFAIHDVTR